VALAKLTRPRLGRLLERRRLFRLLDAPRPLAWVWGPPGAGKTALVVGWLEARRARAIWYQCDAADTSVDAFLDYLARAVGRTPRRPAGNDSLRESVRALFDELDTPFVLVLDGYQEIPAESAVHAVVRVAVEELPPGARSVVTSRGEPPAAFVRLRASRAITAIGWAELRLTASESRALVRRLAPAFPARLLGSLHERAGGWAAGLVLMLQERRGLADERRRVPDGIMQYFASELFARADAETQEILLQTAFLPRLSAAMADALTGRPHAGSLLARLHRQNAFTVQHVAAAAVYEFHPLFRAFLRRHAYAVLTTGQRADIQRRAAVLLERDGDIDAAGELLRAAADWARLAQLVEAHGSALVQDGRADTVAQWIAALPEATLQQRPNLLVQRATARLATEPASARADLEAALAVFRRAGAAASAFRAWAMVVEAIVVEQDDYQALDAALAAFETLVREFPACPSAEHDPDVAASVLHALVHRQPQHRDVGVWVQRALDNAATVRDVDVRVRACVSALTHHLWTGDLERATTLAGELRRLLPSSQVGAAARLGGHLMLARAAWLAGDWRTAGDTLETALALPAVRERHRTRAALVVEAAMVALVAGDAVHARRWLGELGREPSQLSHGVRGHLHLVIGLEALRRGDVATALAEHATLLAVGAQCGSPWLECLARLLGASACLAGGLSDAAPQLREAAELARRLHSPLFEFMTLLTQADAARRAGSAARAVQILALAMPLGRARGFVNTWLWLPGPMAELAALALDAHVEVEYVRQLVQERKLVPAEAPVDVETWPWPVKIFTLGRFEVLIDERPLRFTGKAQRKPLALLRALVGFGGERVREDRLSELLWPDADGDAARQALSTTLHRLRRLLRVEHALVRAEGGISLAREHCWVDVWALERMLARAESAIARSPVRDHEWATSIRWTDRALALYRGDFLGGDPAAASTSATGERIRDRLLRQLRKMGHLWETIGDWHEAAECYERAVGLNDCAEEFYRRLMVAYARQERRSDALRAYDRCRKSLASTLGITPSHETEAVRRTLLA
jgi:ATP/maltotriose-dependent transcriptional regulator MalT/DNA-binding SARP family transcriptional activator